ncbi:thiol-disulfide oxidoreductase DCC family protein [Paenibacillus woosongensis]|uniref:Thiol-disulfide oxidoreductase DCC family protein n=1 Tax=Paenibacillus woosongensis TaxID=307580 RepID=A0AA95I4J7_9BACL|nr:thiol-disulfide oxidoreductase DCC family protein [Paenibacillus woosongensis]WHX50414.1 thiol-disulfide oxidoreductase DCC family protein [Paenibacillus woosongensis]
MAQTSGQHENVVLFDGVCHLCQGAVKFIIRRDPERRFRFASLQSEAGERILQGSQRPDISPGRINTIVLYQNGVYYTRSSAALRIAKGLRFPWPLAFGFIIVPRFIRDAVYRIVAANRYRWFGKDETCLVPTKENKERFLQDG